MKRWLRRIAPIALTSALILGGPHAPAWAQKNSNDTLAQKEQPKEDEGTPVFAYIFTCIIANFVLMTVCRSSRRTVLEEK